MNALGLIINAVSAIVLVLDKTMRRPTKFLLQTLAVADFAALVIGSIVLFAGALPSPDRWRHSYSPYIVKYLYPLVDITLNAAVWTLVLVNAERCVFICWPLNAPRYITMCRARLAVGITWSISVAPYVVQFVQVVISSTVVGGESCNALIGRSSASQIDNYMTIVRPVTTSVLPLSLLFFCDACLVGTLRKSIAVRREQLRSRGRPYDYVTLTETERRRTNKLILVATIYMICQLPKTTTAIVIIISSSAVALQRRSTWERTVEDVEYSCAASSICLSVNSLCNLCMFYLMSARLRQITSDWLSRL